MSGISGKYVQYRAKATQLRKAGFSYNEILQKIPVAKSSISHWCRYVNLTNAQKRRIWDKGISGSIAGIKSIQTEFWRKRCEAFRDGVILSRKLAISNPKFVAGLMLYLAEGTKKSSVVITNSDPRVIKYMVKWLKEFFAIKPKNLVMAIHIHSEQNEKIIKNYWSKITKIPLSNFRKSSIKPESIGYRRRLLENGTVKLIVKMNGSTYMLFKILGAINGFLNLTINEKIEPKNWMSVLPYAKEYKK